MKLLGSLKNCTHLMGRPHAPRLQEAFDRSRGGGRGGFKVDHQGCSIGMMRLPGLG